MSDNQCTYCGQSGHRASQCKRRVITEALETAGSIGLSFSELMEKTGLTRKQTELGLKSMREDGKVFSSEVGSQSRRFLRKEWAESHSLESTHSKAISLALEAISNAGSKGCSSDEIFEACGVYRRAMEKALTELRASGKAFSAGKNSTYRTFATEQFANEYAQSRFLELKANKAKRKRERYPKKQKSSSKLAKKTYVQAQYAAADKSIKAEEPSFVNVQPINPNNVKPQVIERKPGRYEVSGSIIGGFSKIGIGRYLDTA